MKKHQNKGNARASTYNGTNCRVNANCKIIIQYMKAQKEQREIKIQLTMVIDKQSKRQPTLLAAIRLELKTTATCGAAHWA